MNYAQVNGKWYVKNKEGQWADEAGQPALLPKCAKYYLDEAAASRDGYKSMQRPPAPPAPKP